MEIVAAIKIIVAILGFCAVAYVAWGLYEITSPLIKATIIILGLCAFAIFVVWIASNADSITQQLMDKIFSNIH